MFMHFTKYKKRKIEFVKTFKQQNWQIKYYTIEAALTKVNSKCFNAVKQELPIWLKQQNNHNLATYKVATLMLHQGKEGCFAILFWFVDENMIQLYAYLAKKENPTTFELFSDSGIVTCIWELEVIWHERKAWIKHILKQANTPNLRDYLKDGFSNFKKIK